MRWKIIILANTVYALLLALGFILASSCAKKEAPLPPMSVVSNVVCGASNYVEVIVNTHIVAGWKEVRLTKEEQDRLRGEFAELERSSGIKWKPVPINTYVDENGSLVIEPLELKPLKPLKPLKLSYEGCWNGCRLLGISGADIPILASNYARAVALWHTVDSAKFAK